jgi:homoserine O-acetyltransferase
LTANSHVADWWSGLYGEGNIFDPGRYFIVCANILGSCYGTTGPRSINPITGQPYGIDFPHFTIRDMANAHELLRRHLGIEAIQLCIGGSCGGHQVLEFAYILPDTIKNIALLVTSARETAWAIAGHEAQRMAIQADHTWKENRDDAGKDGLMAARGMALLGYRTFASYVERQTDEEHKINDLKAASYIQYQGLKLERRFYAHNYWHLTKALDAHHIGRGRGGTAEALSQLKMPALVVSIDSDLLIPTPEQRYLAMHLPKATYQEITSNFGHDGFLIETDQIRKVVENWWGN